MQEILLWTGLFVGTLALLVKASDWFIDAAEEISLIFKVPPFVIGVSVVALGTSLPELVSSIVAVMSGSSELVVSNVVGSNISNIFFVLGVIAVMNKRIDLNFKFTWVDIALLLGSAGLLWNAINDGYFSIIEIGIFLAALLGYIIYTFKRSQEEETEIVEPPTTPTTENLVMQRDITKKPLPNKVEWKTIGLLFVSGFFIYLSAQYNVRSILELASLLGIGTEVIALTAVSFGTSLPELFVSISAVRKNNAAMALGNVLGSNIFNILGVMGIPALFGNLVIPPAIGGFYIYLMLLATGLYIYFVYDKKLKRWEGLVLLGFYGYFLSKIVHSVL